MKPIKLFEEFINEQLITEDRLNDLENALTKDNAKLFDLLIKVDGIEELLKKLNLEGKTGKTATLKEIEKLASAVNNNKWYDKLPVSYFFDSPPVRLSNNTQLIHFTSKADDIIKNGFTRGTPNLDDLGMSWGSKTSSAGWNYAFELKDVIEKYGSIKKAKRHWHTNDAVVFNAPGIKAYHYGDDIEQVLFWGADAKNIKLFTELDE